MRLVPAEPPAGTHRVSRVPRPDFARAARLGTFLSASGWLVVVVGVVVGLVAATRGEGFALPLFLVCTFGAVVAGTLVVGVGRGLEIVAFVGDRLDGTGRDQPTGGTPTRTVRLPGTRQAVPGP